VIEKHRFGLSTAGALFSRQQQNVVVRGAVVAKKKGGLSGRRPLVFFRDDDDGPEPDRNVTRRCRRNAANGEKEATSAHDMPENRNDTHAQRHRGPSAHTTAPRPF